MLDKCRIIYKGDYLAALLYLFMGIILLITGLFMYQKLSHKSLGYMILSVDIALMGFYWIGKGIWMLINAYIRMRYYQRQIQLDLATANRELTYTEYRLAKKQSNRRRYIYMTAICSIAAFIGYFTDSKAIIMGTSIPIAFVSGMEFGIGLMTEFRLGEFQRQLARFVGR
jgi:hypothetical protein